MADFLTECFGLLTASHPPSFPRQPNPDLRAQALDLLDHPARRREQWAKVMRRLEDEGCETREFAMLCQLELNLLANYVTLFEILKYLSDRLQLPEEKLEQALADLKSQQEEIQPLYELAIRKPSPPSQRKLANMERKYAGQPAIEVGELVRRVQAGEVDSP